MSAGHGKTYGEGNVHAARWRREFAAMPTEELQQRFDAHPKLSGGRLTAYHAAMKAELDKRA